MNEGVYILGIVALVGAYLMFRGSAAAANVFSGSPATVGGNTVPDSSNSVAIQLTPDQVGQVAANAGFAGQDLMTAVAIALAESGGWTSGPKSIGDQGLAPANGPSLGLWQINIGTKAHSEWAGEDLHNPDVNAQKAFILYSRRGQQFTDWSTYNDGTWADYIDQASLATGYSA